MRERLLLALLALGLACGRDLGPSPAVEDGGGAQNDAGVSEPAEAKLATIPCGSIHCSAGQACCLSPGGATCSGLGAACPVDPDAGVSVTPPSPLQCTTYNNCDGGDDCCFTPDAGSKCEGSCGSGQSKLCQRGADNCGSDYECSSFGASPSPTTIGRCIED